MDLKRITYRISFICLVAFLVSCSIQKRVYRKGYHIVWDHKKTKERKNPDHLRTEKTTSTKEELPEAVVVSSNNTKSNAIIPLKNKPLLVLDKDTCGDKLLLQNADELFVKILEIDDQSIKYKRCDNLNGPTYSIAKNKVALITYANGIKETLIQERQQPSLKENRQSPPAERKINLLGLISFLGQMLLILLGQVQFSVLVSPGLVAFFLLTMLTILILAYVSLFQFKKEPLKYKGKWMPIVVVSFYIGFFLLAALTLSVLGSLYGGNGAGPVVGVLLVIALILFMIMVLALIPKKPDPLNVK
jgi:hypothetical protein